MSERPWQVVFPEADRQVYESAGLIARQEFGVKPALLIIDVVESFTGRQGLTQQAAMREYRTSCGPAAWAAVERIKVLLDAARAAGWLVVYTKGDPVNKFFCGNSIKALKRDEAERTHSAAIPELIAPRDDEYVLRKTKASVFFGSPLDCYLRQHGIDTLVVVGTTTSGCIRSSVIEAFSLGFKTFVVDECCFDRSQFSHLVNLYEMHVKYADVVSLAEALQFAKQL